MPQPKDVLWPSEPRTLIKHQVYRHYLQCWMGKICRTFDAATVIDAFAGPGEYSDGPAGSPVVIAETFLQHSALPTFKKLRLVCLEARPDRQAHLAARLAKLPTSPKLEVVLPDPGRAAESFSTLAGLAHPKSGDGPAIWILDPFDLKGVPFEFVKRCLAERRDEVLITWFADEIYRFCGDEPKAGALTAHFGGDHWRGALDRMDESGRKGDLLTAYESGLLNLPNVRTSTVSISSKNETARYSLVFATHDDRGLECFNPVGWRLDPVQGSSINEFRVDQGDLFADSPIISPVHKHLESLAGRAVSFAALLREVQRLGFLEKHLRAALNDSATAGVAVRETPLKARSRWPADCVVRFYHAAGAENDAVDLSQQGVAG